MEQMLNHSHPHVLTPVHVFEDDTNFYTVMPHCLGGCLGDYFKELNNRALENDTPFVYFNEELIYSHISQILWGVRSLHKIKILHRDLKPDNILFEDENRTEVVICDFDLMCFTKAKFPGISSAEETSIPASTEEEAESVEVIKNLFRKNV